MVIHADIDTLDRVLAQPIRGCAALQSVLLVVSQHASHERELF
jgi:hypothetical protein